MQLIHDTYAKQLVDLCEIETQQLWRRDHLVDTEYQVLDTLLEWMASLPLVIGHVSVFWFSYTPIVC